jgi:dephospho-CoA kinase
VEPVGLTPTAASGPTIPLRIGLTGGIGSGKSTVAQMLVRLGAHLVDTDAIARALTAPLGAALPAITEAFGADLIGPDGALDRERMRALAFGDSEHKRRLEALLHPLIGAEAQRQATGGGRPVIVFDVPLLAESGHWRTRVDRVLVVDCSEAAQIERVLRRPGWTRETVRSVITQQALREARRSIADAVIFNDGLTLAQLEAAVTAVYTRWTSAA